MFSSEAVVDVADEKCGGGLAEYILKVMCDQVKGLLLGPVHGDDVYPAQADLQHLQVGTRVMLHVFDFQSSPHINRNALAATLTQEIAVVAC